MGVDGSLVCALDLLAATSARTRRVDMLWHMPLCWWISFLDVYLLLQCLLLWLSHILPFSSNKNSGSTSDMFDVDYVIYFLGWELQTNAVALHEV